VSRDGLIVSLAFQYSIHRSLSLDKDVKQTSITVLLPDNRKEWQTGMESTTPNNERLQENRIFLTNLLVLGIVGLVNYHHNMFDSQFVCDIHTPHQNGIDNVQLCL